MSSVLDEFSFLFSPARHAANNLAMVLLMNLESAVRALPESERGGRQIRRALEAAEEYDGLMRSLLGLTRDAQVARIEAATYLREMLPLLSLAAGRRLSLEADDAGVELEIRRPTLDAALLRLAARMPADAPVALVLRGEVLMMGWEPPAAEAALLREAGAGLTRGEDGWELALPPG
ncbi:hypothetical protein [Roseomonas elaeocarpi]|uniref:Uncharacterized protein n=1 Tax=Roseomonas elaeocarpi TaxID=907779 RepID=A0ABV6K0A9_9PROT